MVSDPAEGCYVGTIPPDTFMKSFMQVQGIPPAPDAVFSQVVPEDNPTHDMCSPFVSFCVSRPHFGRIYILSRIDTCGKEIQAFSWP